VRRRTCDPAGCRLAAASPTTACTSCQNTAERSRSRSPHTDPAASQCTCTVHPQPQSIGRGHGEHLYLPAQARRLQAAPEQLVVVDRLGIWHAAGGNDEDRPAGEVDACPITGTVPSHARYERLVAPSTRPGTPHVPHCWMTLRSRSWASSSVAATAAAVGDGASAMASAVGWRSWKDDNCT